MERENEHTGEDAVNKMRFSGGMTCSNLKVMRGDSCSKEKNILVICGTADTVRFGGKF